MLILKPANERSESAGIKPDKNMKLPKLEHPDRYVSLYVIDFGSICAVGYTAEEVVMLADLADADYSTHPGGKGLRFTDRLRNSFRKTWLRLRKPD